MKQSIQFASKQDIEEVQTLLEDVGLGLSGDIEDHLILRSNSEVCAVGKLYQTEMNCFHLEVLGVRGDYHGNGLGNMFLSALTATPWNYCHPVVVPLSGQYAVTCVAQGDAVQFYEKMGFKAYSFSLLEAKYNEQCDNCPDRETCQPLPMIFESVTF